jgi:SAM-dependent methyltransferase/molecular chaperone GrpE (heat shock protein)
VADPETRPSGEEAQPERGPGGWGLVGRAVQRVVARAARPLFDRVGKEIGALRRAIGEMAHGTAQRIEENERRIDDLREGFLAARAGFEELRDVTVPQLSVRLDALASGSVAAIQTEVERLRDGRLPPLEEAAGKLHRAVGLLQGELAGVRDQRVSRTEADLARLQAAVEDLQVGLAEIRDRRLRRLEETEAAAHTAIESLQAWTDEVERGRLARLQRQEDELHASLEAVQRLTEEVRDERLPALAAHTEALVARLHEAITEVAGLVERLVAGEPLRVASVPGSDAEIPEGVRRASLEFVEAFRGSEREIADRARETVSLLRDHDPVLDLGCGRGELLFALRELGIAASGVDDDPAMVAACRRRGLEVRQADVVTALDSSPPDSLGAITAVHVLEHLPAAAWMTVVDRAARALRSGGLLIVECPNPDSIRVGAGLFWIDPTHRAPVHPEALAFVARAVGLEVVDTLYRRPFPPEQSLRRDGQSADVAELAGRLDAWLSAPRDVVVIARKP